MTERAQKRLKKRNRKSVRKNEERERKLIMEEGEEGAVTVILVKDLNYVYTCF